MVIYFNFPVQLMQCSPDMKSFGINVVDYCCYKHSLKLEGTPEKKIDDAAKYFKVILGSGERAYNNGKQLYDSIPEKSAMTGIGKELIYDFYKSHKSEQEVAVLMAFLAIKSILGAKTYARITKKWLLCRMAGYNSLENMKDGLPEYLRKYTSRWHFDKLITDLRRCYRLKIYGRYVRGLYVSFDLSFEELIRVAEKKRKKYYEREHKNQQSAAVSKVLAELYKTTP